MFSTLIRPVLSSPQRVNALSRYAFNPKPQRLCMRWEHAKTGGIIARWFVRR